MINYVALLRGITPSNPNMKNEKLREVFKKLSFRHVRMIISSGNVLFQSEKSDATSLETLIERAIKTELGFHSTTIIRNQTELEDIAQAQFFAGIEDVPQSRCNVTFLKSDPKNVPSLPRHANSQDSTVLGIQNRAVFSILDTTRTKTPDLMRWLEKEFGTAITTRTWKTVHRIKHNLASESKT